METPPEITQPEDVNVLVVESPAADDTYHTPTSLFRLATWCSLLAWIALVLYTASVLLRVYTDYPQLSTQFSSLGWETIASVILSYLTNLGFGAIWFVLLQSISELIYLGLDLYDNTRKA